ncbi:MAG: MBL fold metallo-hydrolase [Chthoniobacteraceae bacterium]|jgi:glyoxylase-like metal-dependent hydrolase (beta-lactamase superfamily II)
MPIPLEDNFADIIGKAQRGLHLSDSALSERVGVTGEEIQRLRAGHFNTAVARRIAPALGLDPLALIEIGQNEYTPREIGALEGLAQFNTPFDDMTVNAYLVWDLAAKEAASFDTGSDCSGILDQLQSLGLKLRYIFLTHTHGDHIFDLDRLAGATGAPALVSSREPLDGAEPFEPGREFPLGSLRIGTRSTWGHSRGGITYVVTGLLRPVAIVGDALFAGSMGGGMASYADAVSTNRQEIFSLPDDTVICPGHGPMTSVAEEKKHNPFFAARS